MIWYPKILTLLKAKRGTLRMKRCLIVVAISCPILAAGCAERPVIPVSAEDQSNDAQNRDYFTFAIENLNRLSQFGPKQILSQIVDRLNQWSRIEQPRTAWQLDSLLSTLPEEFQSGPLIEGLESPEYNPYDGAYLREAAILHSIAEYTTRNSKNELAAAEDLFRWTMTHVALDPDSQTDQPPGAQMPWQTLLLGHGRAIDRAWVFALLARQLDYDVVLLYLPESNNAKSSTLRLWCAGLLLNGQIYLFDPTMGIPLPGPSDSVATLSDLRTDPQLLRKWDLSGAPYWVTEKSLSNVVPFIESSTQSLSKRMKTIQDELSGEYRMRLISSPSRIADQLTEIGQTARPRIWIWPFAAERIIADPQNQTRERLNREMQPYGKFVTEAVNPLWAGRLQQLAGRYTTQIDGVPRRPRDAPIGEQGAKPLMLSSRTMFQRIPKDDLPANLKEQIDLLSDVIRRDATWNLAMIAFDEGNYSLAEYYLDETEKQQTATSWPADAKAQDVTMARGRVAQDAGQLRKAINWYRKVQGPQQTEAKIRARDLSKQLSAEDQR